MKTEKMIEALEKIAFKLGTTAEKLFSYYVKNANLFRIYFIIRIITSLAIFPVCLYIANISYEPCFGKTPCTFINIALFGIGSTLGIISLIVFLVHVFTIDEYIESIKNPEYKAIQDLLETLFN